MFPYGGPGLALFLLRISVVATFLLGAASRLDVYASHVVFAGVLLICVFLTVGLLTPVVSFIAGLSAFASLVFGYRLESLVLVSLILNSSALALLGPGAYSLDARLYGRRIMIVSPRRGARRL
jgi:hypothetical protein